MSDVDHTYSSESSSSSSHIALMASRVSGAMVRQKGVVAWASTLPADHIGTLLLAASWLEDQSTEDESEALETLFSEYLLPWCGAFLGKVEAHATTPFWRTMAPLTRDAISAKIGRAHV